MSRLFALEQEPSLDAFKKLTSQSSKLSAYPLASELVSNIPIYDLSKLAPSSALADEWHHILHAGPGVYILKHFSDPSLINGVNEVFSAIIDSERASSKGDHFAAAGSNSRIWNSFQKHAEKDPSSFVPYYSNPWLVHVAESWLGPAYQVTAQVNVVHPGGKPQMAHRDYHIGFQTAEASANFPKAMHIASQFLTLQGAVAHSNMPLESGPTRFLPFSQMFDEGFMAYRLPHFRDHFEKTWVSAPLEKGDAVFFNPALFHAAGQNDSKNERSANLLQISSAFGRTMETIDTQRIIEKTWSEVAKTSDPEAIIKAIGQGYPFPTNLDLRPPQSGGMAPESEQDILRRAWKENWDTRKTVDAIQQIRHDSTTVAPA
jgi:ectoine hydroxylase-related dioxygenase (phytanoyl-CoA dioxygenase family)